MHHTSSPVKPQQITGAPQFEPLRVVFARDQKFKKNKSISDHVQRWIDTDKIEEHQMNSHRAPEGIILCNFLISKLGGNFIFSASLWQLKS